MKTKTRLMLAFILLITSLSISYCSGPNKEDRGKGIVMQNCVSCHASKGDMNNQIAPPLIAVKRHYLNHYKTKSAFVENMVSFLMNPNIQQSKMPKAVEKFNLMPGMGMTKEDYEAVANYIYETSLEKPDWFEEHHKKENLNNHANIQNLDPLKKGLQLALATKSILGKNLLMAIKTKGTVGALQFCNEKATLLTDSMANELNASIKRVSDQNRNPKNMANKQELEYILQAKKELAKNGKALPMVQESVDQTIGYYPIVTNAMCLQCHGNKQSDISNDVIAQINRLYPNDLATGYSINQLRGIWVIAMDK